MGLEIYAICCCRDVNLQNVSTASSSTAPFLAPDMAKDLLKQIIEPTAKRECFKSNQEILPEPYTTKSVLEANKFHLFYYKDFTHTPMVRGCFVIIGSENLKDLPFSKKCKLSQNILAEGRELNDILNEPERFMNEIVITNKQMDKHSITIAPASKGHTTTNPFSGCVLPGCVIS